MRKHTSQNKTEPAQRSKLSSEAIGIFCLCITILLFLSVASYDSRDPSLNHVVRGAQGLRNWTGIFGAYLSAFLVDFFGFSAYTPCILAGTITVKYLRKMSAWAWWRWAAFIPLAACLAVAGAAWNIGLGEVRGGGLIGRLLYDLSVQIFSSIGTSVIWVCAFLLALQSIGGFSWRQISSAVTQRISKALDEASERSRLSKELARNAQEALQTQQANESRIEYNEPAPAAKPELVWPGSDLSGDKTTVQNRAIAENKRLPLISISSSEELLPAAETSSKHSVMGRIKGLFSISSSAEKNETSNTKSKKHSSGETPPWLDDLEHDRIGAPQNAAVSMSNPSVNSSGNGNTPLASNTAQNAAMAGAAPAAGPSGTSTAQQAGSALNGVVIDDEYKAPQDEAAQPRRAPARLPSLNLLRTPEKSKHGISRQELEEKGRDLMTCLNDFSIQAELVRITPGPVVTSFEIRPAPGVKSARISALSDDIALGLKAISVRIQAPIPGTDTVGIEIPNTVREIVYLRELLASKEFNSAESLLTMALGKDSSGVPTSADLARMPHMLVAGATGTGKSVFLNSVLMSILYKARPEEVKLLLVDPKRIELAVYADLPHLVHPIVTDMSLAKNALDWAVSEMEERYNNIARLGVRNILGYNEKLKEMGSKLPPDLSDLKPMPYLVLIIDELADLMLTAGKDVETSIVRLAQLARAAGIHLIIATQRPSVDVVTGLIKANFPCRISFQVTSKHDSRTILDAVGAEHLLGRGDMLFKPAGGRFQRLHGAFVSDDEVSAVSDYWRKQQRPTYHVDFAEWGAQQAEAAAGPIPFSSDDQKYNEAVAFVREQGKASISLIQRRFRIGFNSAARIMDQMEADGIVGPADGSKPRVVR